MTGGDNSLIGGVVPAGTLVAANFLFGRIRRRLPFFTRLFAESPTLLLKDGKPIKEHLEREQVSEDEVAMAAREHGIDDLAQVSAAILEVDGSISIIPREGQRVHRTLRHVRQFRQRP